MSVKRCVVIDDSQLVLAMATDALETAGFEVAATDSGIEANQYIFGTPPPDIIIIDVMMSFMRNRSPLIDMLLPSS